MPEKVLPWFVALFALAAGTLLGAYIAPSENLENLQAAFQNLPARIEKTCGQLQGKEEILKELKNLKEKQGIAIMDTRALQDHLEGMKQALQVMAERYWQQTQPKR